MTKTFINAMGIEVPVIGGSTPQAPEIGKNAKAQQIIQSDTHAIDVYGRLYDPAVPVFISLNDPSGMVLDRLVFDGRRGTGTSGYLVNIDSLIARRQITGHKWGDREHSYTMPVSEPSPDDPDYEFWIWLTTTFPGYPDGGGNGSVPAPGWGGGTPPITSEPINNTAPSLSGGPEIGQTITLDDGNWTINPAETSRSRRWYFDGNERTPLRGQSSFVAEIDDWGATVTADVTVENIDGTTTEPSSNNVVLGGVNPLEAHPDWTVISGSPVSGWAMNGLNQLVAQGPAGGSEVQTAFTDTVAEDLIMDCSVILDTAGVSSPHFFFCIRMTDANNFIGLVINGSTGTGQIWQKFSGTFTQLGTDFTYVPGTTYAVEMEALLNDITVRWGAEEQTVTTDVRGEGRLGVVGRAWNLGPHAYFENWNFTALDTFKVVTPGTISGTPEIGQTLTASNPVYSIPASVVRQWMRNGTQIVGETGSTYRVGDADRGFTITCRFTAVNSGRTLVSVSNALYVSSPPLAVTPPVIEFADNDPGALFSFTSEGTWDFGLVVETGRTYQWRNSGSDIPGAINSTYSTTVEGNYSCRVTVTNADGSVSQNSNTITVTEIVNITLPVISGEASIPATLSCSPGTWSGTPVPTSTYQWQRNGVDVVGATNQSYTTVIEDAGDVIDCVVTTSNGFDTLIVSAAGTKLITFYDEFDRDDGAIGVEYATLANAMIIGTEQARAAGTAGGSPWQYGAAITTWDDDQYIEILHGYDAFSSTGHIGGIAFRVDPNGGDRAAGWVFGHQPGSNRWIVGNAPANSGFAAVEAIDATNRDIVNGNLLRVELEGDQIRCYVDGVLIFDVTDTLYPNKSKCGFTVRNTNGGPWIDNFYVADLAVGSAPSSVDPPVWTVLPMITGPLNVPGPLTCSSGNWSGADTFTYQWRRDGVDIAGATASMYDTTTADIFTDITCVVSASNVQHTRQVTSALVEVLPEQPFWGETPTSMAASWQRFGVDGRSYEAVDIAQWASIQFRDIDSNVPINYHFEVDELPTGGDLYMRPNANSDNDVVINRTGVFEGTITHTNGEGGFIRFGNQADGVTGRFALANVWFWNQGVRGDPSILPVIDMSVGSGIGLGAPDGAGFYRYQYGSISPNKIGAIEMTINSISDSTNEINLGKQGAAPFVDGETGVTWFYNLDADVHEVYTPFTSQSYLSDGSDQTLLKTRLRDVVGQSITMQYRLDEGLRHPTTWPTITHNAAIEPGIGTKFTGTPATGFLDPVPTLTNQFMVANVLVGNPGDTTYVATTADAGKNVQYVTIADSPDWPSKTFWSAAILLPEADTYDVIWTIGQDSGGIGFFANNEGAVARYGEAAPRSVDGQGFFGLLVAKAPNRLDFRTTATDPFSTVTISLPTLVEGGAWAMTWGGQWYQVTRNQAFENELSSLNTMDIGVRFDTAPSHVMTVGSANGANNGSTAGHWDSEAWNQQGWVEPHFIDGRELQGMYAQFELFTIQFKVAQAFPNGLTVRILGRELVFPGDATAKTAWQVATDDTLLGEVNAAFGTDIYVAVVIP